MPGHEFQIPNTFLGRSSKGAHKRKQAFGNHKRQCRNDIGLYPKKGSIGIGSDADLVILDPNLEKTIRKEDSLYGMDWYPCDRLKVKGWPIVTIFRGNVLWENGQFQGKAGDGQFLKRKIPPELFKGVIA